MVCALSVRNLDNALKRSDVRITGLEATVKSMQATQYASQTKMIKTIDQLSEDLKEQEVLIVELERIINNR